MSDGRVYDHDPDGFGDVLPRSPFYARLGDGALVVSFYPTAPAYDPAETPLKEAGFPASVDDDHNDWIAACCDYLVKALKVNRELLSLEDLPRPRLLQLVQEVTGAALRRQLVTQKLNLQEHDYFKYGELDFFHLMVYTLNCFANYVSNENADILLEEAEAADIVDDDFVQMMKQTFGKKTEPADEGLADLTDEEFGKIVENIKKENDGNDGKETK